MGDMLRIKINPLAVASMLRSPTGAVGRKLTLAGQVAEALAKAKAPKGMRSDIHAFTTVGVTGLTVILRCDHKATVWVNEGTVPHDIPFKKPQALMFKVGWRTVTVVHHPGTKANPFLKDAMKEAFGPHVL